MKKTYFYLFLLIIAYSCSNKKKEKVTVNKPEVEESIEIRQFSFNQNLFQDFYKGMNRQEIKEVLKRKIGKSEFFIKKSNVIDYWKIDLDHLNNLSVNNIDSLNNYHGFDRIYYKFSNGNITYYAKVDFEFSSYSSLGNLTLILPDYKTQSKRNVRAIERELEQGKILSNSINRMYKNKYGSPKIEVGQRSAFTELFYSAMNAEKIYNENFNYLEDKYLYHQNDSNKMVTITNSLNSVQINYSLYSDYLQNKTKQENRIRNHKERLNNNYQKTLDDI